MIDGILDLVRTQVVAPQAAMPAPGPGELDRRATLDPENAPIGVDVAEVEVIAESTSPINPEVGNGPGNVGGVLQLRHLIAVVVTCQDTTRAGASAIRGAIATDLMRRIYLVDWVNASIGTDQDISKVSVTVEYADLVTGQLTAYATITLTVDTEWRL